MDNNKIEKIVETYQNNKNTFILLGIFILILLLIFVKLSFSSRKRDTIKEYKYHINKTNNKIKKCYQIDNKEYKPLLCDYDICSSFNTGLIGNQKFDYISLEMIKKIMLSGARYLEFQIVSNEYTDEPEPYIGVGEEEGNYIYTLNVLDVKDVFNLINKYSFYDDNNNPLIIYIKFTNFKKYLINKTGNIINDILKKNLLDPSNYKETIITQEKLCNLTNKIIIFSNLTDLQLKDTSFRFINIPQNGYIKRLYYSDALKYLYYENDRELTKDEILLKSYSRTFRKTEESKFKTLYQSRQNILSKTGDDYFNDLLEKNLFNPLLHFNKIGITILLPHKTDDIFTKNVKYDLFREHGIQVITMNFQLFNSSPKAPFEDGSTILDKYLYYFRQDSFKLKSAPKFHRAPRYDINIHNDIGEEKKFVPEFEPNISSDFNNVPIFIELYPKDNEFLSLNKKNLEFSNNKTLFMIYPSFGKKYIHQNSFVLSPLNNDLDFDYTKRDFIYNNDALKKYELKKLEKDIDKEDDFFNKSSINLLNVPVCDNNPIISKDFKLVTMTNIDYKKEEQVKYIGKKEGILSHYEMNNDQENINNSCFIFRKYYKYDEDTNKGYRLFISFKIHNKDLYLSSKLKFEKKKIINDKFEVINHDNIFNNNTDIMNTSNSFNLKNKDKIIKYNQFNVTKKIDGNALFKIVIDSTGFQKIYLYNELEKRFSFELTYQNNKFDFISSENLKKTNNIHCFVNYRI